MSELQEIFNAYAKYGHSPRQLKKNPELQGRDLIKLIKQSKLINKRMPVSSVDLIFAKHKTKGKKVINFDQFNNVLASIAKARGETLQQVKDAVIASGKPQSVGTKAEACKFHDDKSLYTGTWADGKGGPDKFGKGKEDKLKLQNIMDRSAADVRGVKKKKDVNGNYIE